MHLIAATSSSSTVTAMLQVFIPHAAVPEHVAFAYEAQHNVNISACQQKQTHETPKRIEQNARADRRHSPALLLRVVEWSGAGRGGSSSNHVRGAFRFWIGSLIRPLADLLYPFVLVVTEPVVGIHPAAVIEQLHHQSCQVLGVVQPAVRPAYRASCTTIV